jgi:hypothetical protein
MEAPEYFDWVGECLKCSLEGAFLTLRETVDSDIKKWNQLRPDFHVVMNSSFGTDKFLVNVPYVPAAAVFEISREHRRIDIRRGPELALSAKPEICPDGQCRLRVNQELLRFWQVSQRALSDLLI